MKAVSKPCKADFLNYEEIYIIFPSLTKTGVHLPTGNSFISFIPKKLYQYPWWALK